MPEENLATPTPTVSGSTPNTAPPANSGLGAVPASVPSAGIPAESNVANTATSTPSEPADPYAAFSSPASAATNPSSPVQGEVPDSSEGTVTSQPSSPSSPESVVTTSHSGNRRRILMILGALALVVILLIVGSFVYNTFTNQSEPNPTPTPSSTTAAPTKAASVSATPTPANNLPSDVPAYGTTALTLVTGPKGQIRTDQKTADAVDKVINFYKDELTKKGWKLSAVTNVDKGKQLTGTKDGRQIVVLVTNDGSQTTIGMIINNPTSLGNTGLPKSGIGPSLPSTASASSSADLP